MAMDLDEYRPAAALSEAELIYAHGMRLGQFDRALRSGPPPTACPPPGDVSREDPGASAEARFGALERQQVSS